MSRNCWGTLAFLLGSVTYWQWVKPYELVRMYFNIARVSLGLAVILMSGSLNFPRKYYYFLWVNVLFSEIWVASNIQQNIATPQLLSFYSKGNQKLQTPEAWTREPGSAGPHWFEVVQLLLISLWLQVIFMPLDTCQLWRFASKQRDVQVSKVKTTQMT